MKALLITLALCSSASALADTFACTLRIGDTYTTEYESEHRSRQVSVSLGAHTCDGSFANGVMSALIYQAGLESTEDSLTGIGDARGVKIELNGVACSCSLM